MSDVKFSNCGRYILSRDFLTLKVWDVNMESKPLKTIQVRVHLSLLSCLSLGGCLSISHCNPYDITSVLVLEWGRCMGSKAPRGVLYSPQVVLLSDQPLSARCAPGTR